MKQFHEAVVNSWKASLEDALANADPEYIAARSTHQTTAAAVAAALELPFVSGAAARIVGEATRALGVSIRVFGETPFDAVPFESESVRWRRQWRERLDGRHTVATTTADQASTSAAAMDAETLAAYIDDMPEPDAVLAHVTKLLNSASTNEEIQFEVCLRLQLLLDCISTFT